MAILKGEAARKYLEQNPQNVKRIISGGEGLDTSMVGKEKGFGGLLGMLTQPFARLSEGTNQGLYKLMNMITGENLVPQALNEKVLGTDVTRSIQKNPLVQGIGKGAAGIGAYAIPGGSGFLQGVGRGAIAGGLAGFGASGEGKEVGSALTGGITGGAVGGLLGMLGKGRVAKDAVKGKSGKTGDFGLKVRSESIGLDANKLTKMRGSSISSSTQGNQEIKKFFNTMDELGYNTSTSEAASRSADEALATVRNSFDELLTSADNLTSFNGKDTGNIVNKITSSFKNNPQVQKSAVFQELIGDLTDLGNSYTPTQLNAVREKARDLVNWASQNSKGSSQRAASSIFDSIDDFFKASVPESGPILDTMRNIYTIRPALQSKAIIAGSIPVGTASTNLKLPTGAIQERIGAGIGRALQGARPAVSAQNPSQLLQNLSKVGQRSIPLAGAGLSGIIGSEQGQMADTGGVQEQSIQQSGATIDPMVIAQMVMSGQLTVQEAKYLQELLGGGQGGEKKMTQAQANATSAIQSLDVMEQILDKDSGALLKTYLPFEGFNDNAQMLEAAALNVEDIIARMRTGAVINDEEAKRYRKMIPRITDKPANRVFKLQQLRNVFNNMAIQNGQSDIGALLGTLGIQQ